MTLTNATHHRVRFAVTVSTLLLLTACATSSTTRGNSNAPNGMAHRSDQSLTPFWDPQRAVNTHVLLPTPTTVTYGGYDAASQPVLRVRSGDDVVLSAVSTCGTRLLQAGMDSGTVEPAYRAITQAVRDSILKRGPGGHILTGPIFVEGAEPGDVLEVRIKQVDIAIPFACNSFGPRSGFLPEDFPGTSRSRIVPLDTVRMLGHFSDSAGISIPLHPFFGSMGVAPPTGRVNSAPPAKHAGNLDNKELTAGTILFIPVHVRGALFQAGDGHAAQGDGEVDITALETALRGRFQLIVRKDMQLTWPRGETRTHWIAMGTDTSLTVAAKIAVREAIALLGDVKKMSREDAYMLVSTACDVRITQLVDGTMGVHVMIPKQLFTR